MKRMIYHKIFIAEQRVKEVLQRHNEKLATIDRIKDFMNRVDANAEFIAVSRLEDLERVISELKGDRLNDMEKEMVCEIFNVDRRDKERYKSN